jgi:4-alpha-glucanotransferase
MENLDTREWLLTNGLGSFASGTVCDARTRIYHGWLIAALDPPDRRTLLLSHLEASLELDGKNFALGTNFWTGNTVDPWGYRWLQSFHIDPVPTWVWGDDQTWQLSRQIVMPYGLPAEINHAEVAPTATVPFCNRVLVQYRYTGSQVATVRLRLLIGDRNYHHRQQQQAGQTFSQLVNSNQIFLQALQDGKPGTPWFLRWTQGQYQVDETWYWGYFYPEEARRGLDYLEDLFSPGYLTVLLQPGDSLLLEARVGLPTVAIADLTASSFEEIVQAEEQRRDRQFAPIWQQEHDGLSEQRRQQIRLQRQLLRASDQFVTYQAFSADTTILAGYHWFGDRTRDTLLCLPGFALTTQRFSLARRLLDRLGRLCHQGLLPNPVADAERSLAYQTIDCSLWWIETLGLYLEATQDWDFLAEQYAVVKQIYKAFTAGTLHNIRVDASDGLVTWDDGSVALTWMDTLVDGQPVNPRHGKPVEVNALWYSALCWASQWATRLSHTPTATSNLPSLSNQARRYTDQAQQVNASLQKFWNEKQGYLFDRIEPDDRLNPIIRPNAVLALSLHHCAFTNQQAQQVLQVARDRLLTPYGLRSLDPADSAYIRRYEGNPRQRDFASHQGTVWSWLLGPFLRAWIRFYGHESNQLPLDLNPLLKHFRQEGCFEAISELFDAEMPYHPRGAIAQAVAIAELLRIWQNLEFH